MKDNFRLLALALLMLLCSQVAMANCGTTDYSGNTGRLYDMVTYVLTMCSYVAQLMYAIATLLSLYSATNIYIKMQTGEEGFTKSGIILIGSLIFLCVSTVVFPSFFGFHYGVTDHLW